MSREEEVLMKKDFEQFTLKWANPGFKAGLGHKWIWSFPFQVEQDSETDSQQSESMNPIQIQQSKIGEPNIP